MNYQTHSLPNGLRLIFKPDKTAVTYCGIVINTGSRDELEHEQGMAHFIEHMLFKGTEKRRSGHIINRLEHVGGELNAFTGKEETVVYATVLNEYTDRAMELLADIVFHSSFPQKEIDKEIVIIIDEISSYNDSPSELIYDDFEELIFKNHSLGHNILGNAEVLRNLKTSDANNFIKHQYRPDEMVLFILGDLNFNQLVKKTEKYFQVADNFSTKSLRNTPEQYQPIQQKVERNTHQVHFMVGNRAYNLYHPQRIGMFLLNNILGGPGMNSMLNLSLREKHGLVYHVESSFQPFSDTGIWSVYFGCDPENANKCEQLVYRQLRKLKDERLSDNILKKYKLQLMGQMAISSENKESMALSMGKSLLRYGKVDDLNEIRKKIEVITSEDLQMIANEIFDFEQFTTLKYT